MTAGWNPPPTPKWDPVWGPVRSTLATVRHYRRQMEHGATLTIRVRAELILTQLEHDFAEHLAAAAREGLQ